MKARLVNAPTTNTIMACFQNSLVILQTAIQSMRKLDYNKLDTGS